MKKKIKLGGLYTDKVTGFTGKATCISTFYLNPTKRVMLEDKEGDNGKVIETWVDETRLITA